MTATFAYEYYPGSTDTLVPLSVDQGGRLFLANLDPLGAHSLVAWDTDAFGDPLFRTPATNFSEQTEATGIASLTPGTYGFYCDVHGGVMQGSLTVA